MNLWIFQYSKIIDTQVWIWEFMIISFFFIIVPSFSVTSLMENHIATYPATLQSLPLLVGLYFSVQNVFSNTTFEQFFCMATLNIYTTTSLNPGFFSLFLFMRNVLFPKSKPSFVTLTQCNDPASWHGLFILFPNKYCRPYVISLSYHFYMRYSSDNNSHLFV